MEAIKPEIRANELVAGAPLRNYPLEGAYPYPDSRPYSWIWRRVEGRGSTDGTKGEG